MEVSGTKRRRISHEGFFYTEERDHGENVYLKCSLWKRKFCRGRAVIRGDEVLETKPHNHAPSASTIEKAQARAEMKQRATLTTESSAAIRDAAEAGLSQATRAEMPRAADILRSIARYRRASGNTRREPTTLEDFELPEELRNTMARPGSPSERFLLYDSRNDEEYGGRRMMVFASDWGLLKLADARHWLADGTFKVAPAVFEQLYTIHASEHDQVFPCVYALLPDKQEPTYRKLLEIIKTAIEELRPGADGVGGTILTDLEKAATNAFRAVFPDKQQSVCFFHFCQAIWRKAQQLGLQRQYGEDADFALQVGTNLNLITKPLPPPPPLDPPVLPRCREWCRVESH